MPVTNNNSYYRTLWVNSVFLGVRKPAADAVGPVFHCFWILLKPVDMGTPLLLNWYLCYCWQNLTLDLTAKHLLRRKRFLTAVNAMCDTGPPGYLHFSRGVFFFDSVTESVLSPLYCESSRKWKHVSWLSYYNYTWPKASLQLTNFFLSSFGMSK